MDEPKLTPASHSISPFFMEDDDPEKFVKKGEVTWSACNLFLSSGHTKVPLRQGVLSIRGGYVFKLSTGCHLRVYFILDY